jgi:hypothetical protein
MSDTVKKGLKGTGITVALAIISLITSWLGYHYVFRADVETAAKVSAATLEEKYLAAFTRELDSLRAESKVKAEELKMLYEANRDLRKENSEVRDLLRRYEVTSVPQDAKQLIELVFNSMPYPAWLHEVGKNNWYLNDSYSTIFHINRANFWTPINILRRYPSEVSAKYVANDMHVVEARVGQIFTEKVNQMVLYPEGPDNPAKEWTVLKIPMVVEGKSYVFGACVDGVVPDSIFTPFKNNG